MEDNCGAGVTSPTLVSWCCHDKKNDFSEIIDYNSLVTLENWIVIISVMFDLLKVLFLTGDFNENILILSNFMTWERKNKIFELNYANGVGKV